MLQLLQNEHGVVSAVSAVYRSRASGGHIGLLGPYKKISAYAKPDCHIPASFCRSHAGHGGDKTQKAQGFLIIYTHSIYVNMLYYIKLYYTILYYIILYYTILYYIIWYYII